ncbi:hypothetical protein [Saccharothrix yanglingensis]|uniref:Uncharacterized protein n=1 Tax=Saccharothrix yanglingensis TaxID=659496 RepID=A0ABU0X900_9PSEU|nr:hypothetical protein [Saccharothrix yanglingensis]MDQ2588183.1 hypothetical protein [Saccharothrix yanglingensis]
MEWTPEAVKAEIDYRQAALRADAARARASRQPRTPRRPWWRGLGHRAAPEAGEGGNRRPEAA